MDKPISIGDLVVVVKPVTCCGSAKRLGWIFRVDHMQGGPNYCGQCKANWGESLDVWARGSSWCVPVANVKRIPPIGELEGEKRETSIPDLVEAIKRAIAPRPELQGLPLEYQHHD